jgi:murein DD-endopeptidase MepM/ murein hydrolase activator NlpD
VKAALLLTAFLAVVITALPAHQSESPSEAPVSLQLEVAEAADFVSVNEPPVKQEQMEASNSRWINMTIQPGDNLARIFKRNKLPAADLQNIVNLGKPVSSLRKILPGQKLGFKITSSGELLAIRYKKNAFDTLLIHRQDQSFVASWQSATPETIVAFESAKITKQNPSLYHAGKAAGLSDNIIMKLSHIYQWDISFALDLRAGDSFSLMFEEIYVDGELVKEGSIIAAVFTNMGKRHEAVKYTDIEGHSDYYTPEGLSMRKAFLRDPVHFSYVSSSFNLRRLHPIHKKVMPHRGIDYAAKRGTPVLASGDGKVTIRRQNNASGKYITESNTQLNTSTCRRLARASSLASRSNKGRQLATSELPDGRLRHTCTTSSWSPACIATPRPYHCQKHCPSPRTSWKGSGIVCRQYWLDSNLFQARGTRRYPQVIAQVAAR